VRARIRTMRGPVAVEWTKENGSLRMNITIPANSTATVHVPATSASTVSSTPRLAKRRFGNGAASFLVGSGSYEFQVAAGKP
jgi:alpha-L-rhamnosidase